MAEVESQTPPVKDPKQLKKEHKEQERLRKEREKQEKKLERERKKREEAERKQREREARRKGQQPQQQPASNGDAVDENSTAKDGPTTNGDAASSGANPDAGTPEPPPQKDKSPSPPPPAAPADTAAPAASTNGEQRSSPEKVTVAEPPGQISGCGSPIGIVFDATQAGEGPLTATCTGAKVGGVPTTVTELREGVFSVKFTPNAADVYSLSVCWGGREITGAPFAINLSRLLPAQQEAAVTAQPTEEKKKNGGNGKEEEEVEEISDDPFEMAFQASRILEEQRRQAATSQASSTTPPASPPRHPSPKQPHTPRQTYPAAYQAQQSGSPLPYPAPGSALPFPEGFPATKEDVRYLEEINQKLQQTNQGLGQDVADLKKKMGEFEAKLTNIEETSRAAEEEKRELMANISLQGWLYKRGIKGPTANVWRHRYFRCDQGSKIYYYKAADEPTPKGYIDLEKIESVEEVEGEAGSESGGGDKFNFNIQCQDRTFQLQTESDDTRKRWMSAIEYLKNWHQKNSSTLHSL